MMESKRCKMNLKEIIIKYSWIKTLLGLVGGAIITILVEKSCDRIIPDDPVIIKEVADTLKIVHTYDFGHYNDSIINAQLQNRLKNIELMEKYDEEILKQIDTKPRYCSVMLDASFPNAKGYSPRNAASYCSLNISSFHNDYIDFELLFFDNSVLERIYCISIKIFRIVDGKRTYFLEENYNIGGVNNKIRMTNNLPNGKYELCVGFVFKKDINDIYPEVYQLSKILTK